MAPHPLAVYPDSARVIAVVVKLDPAVAVCPLLITAAEESIVDHHADVSARLATVIDHSH